jgi:hypothetical protein
MGNSRQQITHITSQQRSWSNLRASACLGRCCRRTYTLLHRKARKRLVQSPHQPQGRKSHQRYRTVWASMVVLHHCSHHAAVSHAAPCPRPASLHSGCLPGFQVLFHVNCDNVTTRAEIVPSFDWTDTGTSTFVHVHIRQSGVENHSTPVTLTCTINTIKQLETVLPLDKRQHPGSRRLVHIHLVTPHSWMMAVGHAMSNQSIIDRTHHFRTS